MLSDGDETTAREQGPPEGRTSSEKEPDSFFSRLGAAQDPLALLETLLEHTPTPYAIFGVDGHNLATNPACVKLFGNAPPAGYNILQDPTTARHGVDGIVRRAFAGEIVETPPIWYDPKDLPADLDTRGTKRAAIACRLVPVRDCNGVVTCVIVAYRDLTAELEGRARVEREFSHLRDLAEEKDRLASALREREASLRASERQLRLITDSLPALVAYVDRDRYFRFTNEAYRAWLGVDPASLVGKHTRTLMGDTGYAQITPYVERALRGERVQYERELTLADGRTIYAQMNYVPDKDDDGHTQGYVTLVHDLTDRRHAELAAHAERKRLHEILMHAPVAITLQSAPDGVYTFVNEVAARLSEPRQLLGKTLRQAFPGPESEAMVALLERVHATGLAGTQKEVRRVRAGSDEERFLNVTHQPVLDASGQMESVVSFGVDVTSEVEARELAEAASRAKDEFLALLGHELRNPLAPILTALELMRLRDDTPHQNERAVIERHVEHVVHLVDDLLDVSRISRGKVTLKRQHVDLAEVVARAIEQTNSLLDQGGHRLEVRVPRGLTIDGDPMRLAQVFANLLTNAAKYTPRAGSITIEARREGEEGERAVVSVCDTGIGIRAEMLPRIFDLFTQEAQALDRAEGGLGLGLSITRSLVELHGGSVEARSEGLGRGSEFRVCLPMSIGAPASTDVASRSPSSAPAAALRILIVDDNEDAANLLGEVLGDWGHHVQVAHDGPSALGLIERRSPDLALLDIGLPGMDGYELARRIRATPALHAVRLVAITGYGQARDRDTAERAGFQELVVKPVDLATLEGVLSRSHG